MPFLRAVWLTLPGQPEDHQRLIEFRRLQPAGGVPPYREGREGFEAPADWIIPMEWAGNAAKLSRSLYRDGARQVRFLRPVARAASLQGRFGSNPADEAPDSLASGSHRFRR